MGNLPVWDKNTYQFLYACAKKLAAGNPRLQQEIPDVLSRVYLKSCEKQEELRSHPNPMGWLVETMKRTLSEEMHRIRMEESRRPHSVNSEIDMRKIERVHAQRSEATVQKQQCTDDQMALVQEILSPEELHFLLAYYSPHTDRKALARREGLSYDGLRRRASRLVSKIQRRFR